MTAGLCLLAGIAPAAHAQVPEAAESLAAAESVARQTFDAVDDMRWDDLVDLMHPAAIDRLRNRAMRELLWEQTRDEEPHVPSDPNMPEAVREWFRDQTRLFREQMGSRVERVYGVTSVEQLESLSGREFVVRWLDANDARRHMWRQLEMHQPERLRDLDIIEDFRVRRDIIGSVLEGDTLARVLYRQDTSDGEPGVRDLRANVLTLRHHAGRWLVWPATTDPGLFGGADSYVLLMEPTHDPEAVREETERLLVDLNRDMLEAYMLRHDTVPNRAVMHPDYLFLAGIGIVETRDQVLATAGNLDIDSVAIVHEEFILNGTTAILIGRMEVDGRVVGRPLPPVLRYMSVFVNDDHGWRLLARAMTPVQ